MPSVRNTHAPSTQGRIARANRAAMRLLGAHIEGEDARIAIRHPAAAERLASTAPLAEPIMIELVGLGTRDQRWQMRVAPVGLHDPARSGDFGSPAQRLESRFSIL